MRACLKIMTIGIVIGTTVPALAQQNNTSGQEAKIINGIARKFESAYNRKDAAGVASLYTEDAVEVSPAGIIQNRTAVRQRLEKDFQAGVHDLMINLKTAYSAGNIILSAGEWSARIGDQPTHGFFSTVSVRDGAKWKHR